LGVGLVYFLRSVLRFWCNQTLFEVFRLYRRATGKRVREDLFHQQVRLAHRSMATELRSRQRLVLSFSDASLHGQMLALPFHESLVYRLVFPVETLSRNQWLTCRVLLGFLALP
jgi:hypothetical protein